jgi:UDP-glucose 4-epimerase
LWQTVLFLFFTLNKLLTLYIIMKVLITGGSGYIGAHTIVDLIDNGFTVVSIDNHSKSTGELLLGIQKITGQTIENHVVDLCDLSATQAVFAQHQFDAIIHFAAYKSVAESTKQPLLYYKNNMQSLTNLLELAQQYQVPHFIFSSSCSVYGNAQALPVNESAPILQAQSPYAATKQIAEQIIQDVNKISKINFTILRYFNPAGAHPSNCIGEITEDKPSYLVPNITQTAAGIIPQLTVFGSDYATRDGSCVRDLVHVCDIAAAHTLALQASIQANTKSLLEVYNLGSGNGITVLEAIHSFEKINNVKLPYTIGQRRDGDVIAIYADNAKANKQLHWQCKFSLDDIMQSAWNWEKKHRGIL